MNKLNKNLLAVFNKMLKNSNKIYNIKKVKLLTKIKI
jgi:hypothetical protein